MSDGRAALNYESSQPAASKGIEARVLLASQKPDNVERIAKADEFETARKRKGLLDLFGLDRVAESRQK